MSAILADRLARVAWLTDDRFMQLDWGQIEFFRRVHHVCDRNGQFEAKAPVLRSRLYAADRRVSDQQVEAWLEKLRSVGLVGFRVHQGLRLGKVLNWDQALRHTKALYPCDEEAQDELDLAPEPRANSTPALSGAPPARARRSDMKRECGAATRPGPKVPAHTHESDSAWLKRLGEAHADVNIEAELRRAERYVRQKRGDGARVTRKFFETQWLAGCVDQVDVRAAAGSAVVSLVVESEPAPAGWREIIASSNYGPGGLFETNDWGRLPAEVRRWVRQQLATVGAA